MARRARDYKVEYQRRIRLGAQRGLSRSQARGHARKGEAPASSIKIIRRISQPRTMEDQDKAAKELQARYATMRRVNLPSGLVSILEAELGPDWHKVLYGGSP